MMRVRVRSGETFTSKSVDSDLGFPHSRSILIVPRKETASSNANRFCWRHHKADYQPTGYFLPPRSFVYVWACGNVENLTLLVGTQGMADGDDPLNQSETMRPIQIGYGQTISTDMFGGMIHVRSVAGEHAGPARIILGKEAIPIAYYVRGTTSIAQWRHMLRESKAPEVEWVGEHVVVAAFRSTALRRFYNDPAQVVDSHERVLDLQADIAGFDGSAPIHSRSDLLIYAVEGRGSGPPHATTGYISIPYSGGVGGYADALVGGNAGNHWVILHEYGHHFQNQVNSFGPFVEVNVNLYSLAVARFMRNEYTDKLPQRWPATQAWLARPRDEKDFSANAPDPMCIFEQLRLGLGAEFLRSWDRYVRVTAGQLPDGLKGLIISACIVAHYDLGEFFADWGVLKPKHSDIWQAIEELGLPRPPMQLTEVRPYTDLAQ
jgi:hypothetical protein